MFLVLESFYGKTRFVFFKDHEVLVSSFMHTLDPVDFERGIVFDVTGIGTTQQEQTYVHAHLAWSMGESSVICHLFCWQISNKTGDTIFCPRQDS